jgi:hypothetical protein
VIIGNEIAAELTARTCNKQAGPAALDRACLSCGSLGATLAEARAAFVLVMLRRNGLFGLFTLAEEKEYWHALGLTLRQRDEAIDYLVATGQMHLSVGENGVWLELGAKALGERGVP